MSSFISPSRFLSFQYNIYSYKEKKCIVDPPPKKTPDKQTNKKNIWLLAWKKQT